MILYNYPGESFSQDGAILMQPIVHNSFIHDKPATRGLNPQPETVTSRLVGFIDVAAFSYSSITFVVFR